ncbi:hypothetical protein AB3Y40_10900 [Yoonia sp. R2331]|uniref:hypothetical protein n=1 Tax=Yoonia sp. R2331 TaxID=3237238 RepID=UPI0034E3D582
MLRPMWRLILLFLPLPAFACDRPVCLIPAEDQFFAREVTFDDQPSGFGAGRQVHGLMMLDGVQIGERFAGQLLRNEGGFDRVEGPPLAPLQLLPGAETQNMTVIRLADTAVLSGDGPAGYPKREATGEGALAVLFDRDQVAVRFDIRGGEGGAATVLFLRRDGSLIDTAELEPLSEAVYAFTRQGGLRDIAGLVLTNADPDGIALDTLLFDGVDQLS